MRRDDHVARIPERRIGRQRLRLEDVEDRTRQAAARQGGAQGCVVDDRTARNVDQPGTLFHARELVGPDELARLRRQWRAEEDHVAVGEQRVETAGAQHAVDLRMGRPAAAGADDAHPELLAGGRDGAAHVADPDDPGRHAGDGA